MKKNLLFLGLILTVSLLCCYALLAGDAKKESSVVVTQSSPQTVAPLPAPMDMDKAVSSEHMNEAIAKKQHIEELSQQIQGLKEQGLEHAALWTELNQLLGGDEPKARGHLDATGDDCTDPINVSLPPAAWPYVDAGQTNCGRLNSYDATCLGYYDGGEDIIYHLDVTATICVDITLDPGATTYTGICIDGACPPGAACITYSTNSGSGAHGMSGLVLAPGDYYIMIDTWPSPACIPTFDLTIDTCTPPEPCVPDFTGYVDCTTPYTHNSTTVGAGNDCDFEVSEDVIYEITIGEDAEYEFSLCNTDELDAWDSRIYLNDECCGGIELAFDDDDCDTPVGAMSWIKCGDHIALTAGTYYVTIEGYSGDAGAYQLDIACCETEPCIPDFQAYVDCSTPYTHSSTTVGAGNDCDLETSEDIIYEVTIGEDADYEFSLCNTATGWDSRIYLHDACCGGTQIIWDDDDCDSPVGLMSLISCDDAIALTAGTYYVTVEGYSGATGAYQLDIRCCTPMPPCEEWVNCCTPTETEPNNVCPTQVDPHVIVCDDEFCGKICPDTDVDFFPITVPPMTIMTVTTYDGEFCNQNPTQCVETNVYYDDCSFAGGPSTTGWTLTNNGATPWNVFIEVYQANVDCYATYKIVTECCEISSSCDNPIVIPHVLNYKHWESSCCGVNEVPCVFKDACHSSTCYASGPDIIYLMHTWETGNMTITASGAGDNQVMVTTVCGDTSTCVGSADNTYGGQDEVITLTGLPAGIYYISTSVYGETGCNVCTLTIASDVYLPVDLTSFEAIAGNNEVALTWTTAAELNNDYFEVQRSTNSEWTTVGTVDGTNDANGSSYNYMDRAVVNGVAYTYRLLSHDINGAVNEYSLTAEATPQAPLPTEYALGQNYPNPFNPTTTITYALKDAGFVTLKVYNLLGQEVANLVSQRMEIGSYSVNFDANNLPSGIYIYRLEVNDFSAQSKMVLLK
ncbi:T9SS type A sorting domain-containing protein [bacterium]|nr:T9SS type A sorting domain-containing protein [bacterium]